MHWGVDIDILWLQAPITVVYSYTNICVLICDFANTVPKIAQNQIKKTPRVSMWQCCESWIQKP